MSLTNGNGPKIFVVYRFPRGGFLHGDFSIVCSLWTTQDRAEQYIETRKKNSGGIYQEGEFEYGIVPWRSSI